MRQCLLLLVWCTQRSWSLFWGGAEEVYDPSADPTDYGVDVSFPMHYPIKKNLKSADPLKRMFAQRYEDHINACYKKYSFRECDANERARLEMSLDQPAHQHNYTEVGFKKLKAPDELYKPLKDFYESNKAKRKLEMWPRGNTYVNNWHTPTYMVNLEDPRFQPEGYTLKEQTWNHVQPIIEEWTGMKLKPSSLYGVRIYENEAVLATHVDRLPLVSSCIIQIDQDIDEPWPIEVIAHNGKAYNVTMKPGEMVLYESHTVLHGRPFPMKGRSYANVFVHFIPENHERLNNIEQRDIARGLIHPSTSTEDAGGHEASNHDEKSIEKHLQLHDLDHRTKLRGRGNSAENTESRDKGAAAATNGQTKLHYASATGDMKQLGELLRDFVPGEGEDIVNARDENGWMPLHEAARGGHLDVVKYLFANGADLNSESNGGTALEIARQSQKADVISYLVSMKAKDSSIPQEEEN